MNGVIGIILAILGIEDVRKQKISVWVLFGLFLAGAIYGIYRNSFLQCILGVLPGLFLVLLSLWEKRVIGMGDAVVAVAYGVVYGWQHTCLWLMFSFFVAAVVGLFFRLFFKKRPKQMAFIPFMAIVHAGMML